MGHQSVADVDFGAFVDDALVLQLALEGLLMLAPDVFVMSREIGVVQIRSGLAPCLDFNLW